MKRMQISNGMRENLRETAEEIIRTRESERIRKEWVMVKEWKTRGTEEGKWM